MALHPAGCCEYLSVFIVGQTTDRNIKVTFVIAIIGYFVLPDFPATTKWLTQEERDLAHNRMELDTTSNAGNTSTMEGLKQACRDPVVWLFCFMAHMHLAANGFKNFVSPSLSYSSERARADCLQFPSVVKTLGFNTTISLVLTCPPYLIAGAITILVSYSSGKFNERTWHITISKAVATIGFVAAAATLNTAGRYAAMVIFTIGESPSTKPQNKKAPANMLQEPTASTLSSSVGAAPSAARPRRRRPWPSVW